MNGILSGIVGGFCGSILGSVCMALMAAHGRMSRAEELLEWKRALGQTPETEAENDHQSKTEVQHGIDQSKADHDGGTAGYGAPQ